MLDERIWVDVPRFGRFAFLSDNLTACRETARERLIARHLQDGVEATPEAAARRGM